MGPSSAAHWPSDLAGRGFAAVNVEYRRVGDGAAGRRPVQDVAAAVDALRARPTGMDLNRVVALGHSAGGQLAGWLASRRGGAVALTGAVLQAGVLDLVRGSAEGLGGGAIDAYLGGSRLRSRTRMPGFSIALLPLGVPSICVHGTSDTLVPIRPVAGLCRGRSTHGQHPPAVDVRRRPLRSHHRRYPKRGSLCVDVTAAFDERLIVLSLPGVTGRSATEPSYRSRVQEFHHVAVQRLLSSSINNGNPNAKTRMPTIESDGDADSVVALGWRAR